MTFENIRIALDSLWGSKLRSFLALLGIVIGVFAVTTMISLGQIAQAGITRDLESVAGRSIFVQPDYNNVGLSGFKRMNQADVDTLSMLPVTIIPQVSASAEYESRPGQRRTVTMNGSPGNLPKLDASQKLAKGRFFSPSEANSGATVAVLSNKAVQDIYKGRNPVGQTLKLFLDNGNRIEVTVIGTLEPLGGLFGGLFNGGIVYVPNKLIWNRVGDPPQGYYDSATLILKRGAVAKDVQRQAVKVFESRYGVGKFSAETSEAFQGTLNSITLALQALLAAISALSLLVGGIGIMNIMLVSVTERTREIGLRKALGATSALIRQQFLIEAVVLTVTGGLLGVLASIGLLLIVVAVVPFLNTFILNPMTVMIALSVSIGIGLVFGVLPAARASRLHPIEALRYE